MDERVFSLEERTNCNYSHLLNPVLFDSRKLYAAFSQISTDLERNFALFKEKLTVFK